MGEKGKRRDMEARQGPIDPSAYARLCEEHYPRIRRYFAQRLGEGQVADDLAQQVFGELMQGPAPEDPGAYIGAIARNLLSRYLRKQAREATVFRELCRVCCAHRSEDLNRPSDAERLEADWEYLLEDMTAALGPERMKVFKWRYMEDLGVKEIAARLGCSEAAVHMRLQRIIKFFRRRYHVDE